MNGKTIGSAQSCSFDSAGMKNATSRIFTPQEKVIWFTLDGPVTMKTSILNNLLPKVNLEVTRYSQLLPRQPRSKKKRIQKKWAKQVRAITTVGVYEHVEFVKFE